MERRAAVWKARSYGGGLPMFSSDAKLVSTPCADTRDRDAICVLDVATGAARVAVRFAEPFQIATFRANWADDNRAFVVTRAQSTSHIVMFDRFRETGERTAK